MNYTLLTPLAGAPHAVSAKEARMNARLFAPLSITLLAGLALLGLLQPALAAELPVTTLEDELIANGACSLREAIQAANTDSPVDSCPAGSGADVIRLPAGRYELTLVGSGEDDNQSGDFDILDDLEIVGAGAELTVLDGNWLDRVLHVPAGARLNLTELTLTGGRAPSGADGENGADGGAVWSNGPLILTDVILAGNRAGDGGDSASPDEGARAGSGGDGGGIFSSGALSIEASTVTSNVTGAGGVGFFGDGADGAGGGVAVSGAGPLALYATLLTGNYAADASSDCSGAANSAGYNLIGVTDGCSFTGDTAADRMGLAPLLLPLDDHGGPTPTHLPGFTSPAVDAAPCEALDGLPLAADQRGVVRPQGAMCDIGAVEVVPPVSFEFLPLVKQ
jgi:CSLREA domain-containing protein